MRTILIAALVATTCAAGAQEVPAQWGQAMNNLSHEYSDCAAYFGIVAVAMENSGDPETAASYNSVGTQALEYSAIYAEEAGILFETVAARYKMAIEQMSDRIALNTSNIAILGADYAELCLTAMQNPDARTQHWLGETMGFQLPPGVVAE